jgi:8-oxo-dGTP pyrophosphatase MutT (NUDIX family)
MRTPPKKIAHAVLLVNDAYILQLRDDIPGIAARGKYALFGGSLEEGETPEAGLRREICEELSIQLSEVRLFWQVNRHSEFWQRVVHYWFFVADVTAIWPTHVVREGRAAGLFRYNELPGDAVAPLIREVLARHHALEQGA